MPWIKEEKLYPILVLLLIFIMAVRMPIDSDMWWHLRAGEETLRSGQVYSIDTFSSSRFGENWINHSWLSQVLMATFLRIGNFSALSVWVAACAVISLGLVYLQMVGHPLLRGAVLILAGMVSSVVWAPRPQIMSLVLLSVITWLIYNYREKRKWTYLVWISLIFALWGNLHGGYVLGLIYLAAFLAGEIFDKLTFQEKTGGLSWLEIGFVAISSGFGFILVLINPFGLEMWKIPFNTIGVETLQNLISEWASPDFHQAFQQPLLWMLLGLLGILGITRKSIRGYRLVPILIFGWAALVARRNYGPFAIICAPAFVEGLSVFLKDWIEKVRKSIPAIEELINSAEANKQTFNHVARNLINVTLIGLLLTVAVIKTIQVNQKQLVAQAEREFFPVGAVDWIKNQGYPDSLFNDYNWGGYLIYNLPDVPVFVDGRTDLYGDEILKDYLAVMRVEDNWEEILINYGLDTLLISESFNLDQGSGASRVD